MLSVTLRKLPLYWPILAEADHTRILQRAMKIRDAEHTVALSLPPPTATRNCPAAKLLLRAVPVVNFLLDNQDQKSCPQRTDWIMEAREAELCGIKREEVPCGGDSKSPQEW